MCCVHFQFLPGFHVLQFFFSSSLSRIARNAYPSFPVLVVPVYWLLSSSSVVMATASWWLLVALSFAHAISLNMIVLLDNKVQVLGSLAYGA